MDKVVHFEIPVKDPMKAQKFYAGAFGWKISAVPDMEYWLAQTAKTDEKKMMVTETGAINGGIMKREGHLKHPIITIGVEDIDKAAKKIKEMGGKMVKDKTFVMNMGWSAYFEDPEGNVIGLWQAQGM
jgi:uncharacterized protein